VCPLKTREWPSGELEVLEATCTSFRMLVRVIAGIGLVRGRWDGVGIKFILIS
jgi:hypothetical protein